MDLENKQVNRLISKHFEYFTEPISRIIYCDSSVTMYTYVQN